MEAGKANGQHASHQISWPSSWQTLLINLSTDGSPELNKMLLVDHRKADTSLPSLFTMSFANC